MAEKDIRYPVGSVVQRTSIAGFVMFACLIACRLRGRGERGASPVGTPEGNVLPHKVRRARVWLSACSATCAVLLGAAVPTHATTAVDVGAGVGRPGGIACVPATLSGGAGMVTSTVNTISFDAGRFPLNSCTINPAISAGTAADKQLELTSLAAGLELANIFGNLNLLPDGLLYSCTFAIDAGAGVGLYGLANTPGATDTAGDPIATVVGAPGQICVTTCTGDCNCDRLVTIGEVVRCVSKFLGQPLCDVASPNQSCPVADVSLDGHVSIGEVVQCVNSFLNGCPAFPTPTATPTPTPMATDTPIPPTVTAIPADTPTHTPPNPPLDTPTQTPTSTPGLPPDPSTVAPQLDLTVATDPYTSTQFLYTGNDPIQTGVAPGTIEAHRAAIIRGHVTTRDDQPLPGVTITILNHPEFGQTRSRADGMFDLVVNGGGPLTIDYTLAGYLPAQRHVDAPWRDFVAAPDVVLIPRDTQVTTIATNAATLQVARGSVVNDGDGTRQATVLFPAGTGASLVLPDGTLQPVATLNIRATEYTVGANGPNAMPAELPPTSGYTYAVELSADEAVAMVAGREVVLTQPVPVYVENFLGFPVGVNAPVGYYDPDAATWVPSDNGRVIKITAINSGEATVDTVGTQGLPPLALDSAELQALASLYAVGQELWRAPVTHFSKWDVNWGISPPSDAVAPDVDDPESDQPLPDACSVSGNSRIECQNQILGETIGIVGTPFSLHYQSDRVPGRLPMLDVPLSGSTVPSSVVRLDLEISIAGRLFRQSFPAAANQRTTFTWDGRDSYGRLVQGKQPITVMVGYSYQPVYQATPRFGYNGNGIPISNSAARQLLTLWRTWSSYLGTWDARANGLGGWTLSPHHAYDPVQRVLYRGDGTRPQTEFNLGPTIRTFAGPGVIAANLTACYNGEEVRALGAQVCAFDLTTGPDGTVYIAEPVTHRVRKVAPSGLITTVAGTGTACSLTGGCGNGGPATQAQLFSPGWIALGPDGSLYISENQLVQKVGPDGTITAFAGTGVAGFSGDGGLARLARFSHPEGVAVGRDGSVYISDTGNNRVRRVTPDGIVRTVAGTGSSSCTATAPCGDGGPATLAIVAPRGLAVGSDGSLYIAEPGRNRIRQVTPNGIMHTIAGTGVAGFSGDGGPAMLAQLQNGEHIAAGPDDTVYIADAFNNRVRWFRLGGTINTLAGTGVSGRTGDGGLALQARLKYPDGGLAVGPDGSVYVGQLPTGDVDVRVRRIAPLTAQVGGAGLIIPSEDGSAVYLLAPDGRHLQTLDAITGALRYQFAYDGAGRLTSVTDVDGNVTTIQRDGNGDPTAIVGPFGQSTALAVNATPAINAYGYLSQATSPAGENISMTYTPDERGLLTSFTNPRGHTSSYTYDGLGRLTSATDPTGASKTLVKMGTDEDYAVTLTTALGRATTYRVENLPNGSQRRTTTDPAGLLTQTVIARDGTRTTTYPDGTMVVVVLGPDPRWGMRVPLATSVVTTTPGGKVQTTTTQRTVTLTDPTNVLSLATLNETVTVNGRGFTSAYNAASRTFTVTSPTGRRTTSVVDAHGHPAQSQFGGLAASSFTYDLQGRLASVTRGTGPGSRTTTFAYGVNGFLQTITDAAGRTVDLVRDANGRVAELTRADGAQSHFTYDANGNLTTLTPPGQPDHGFAYTQNNQIVSYTAPIVGAQNSQTLTTYDADRLPVETERPDGHTVGLQYDSAGRPSLVDMTVGDTLYAYDAAGRLATVNRDQGANLTYTYDGSLPIDTTWNGPLAGSVTRAYDNNLRVTSLSVNSANPITLTYDSDSLPIQVGALTLTRNAQNALVTGAALGIITETMTYDAFGNTATYTVNQGGNPVYATTYTRDALGRIASKSETIGGIAHTFAYTYDPAGRLTEVRQDSVLTASYSYDSNGNRSSRTDGGGTLTATYDAQDRLEQFGATTYVHNAPGERESKTTAGQTTSYQYDTLGNLTGVTLAGGAQVEYLLDGGHRRVGKEVNGALVQGFLYQDSLRPIAELDASNNVVSRFVYAAGINVPAYMIKAGVTYRIVTDHLGSPRLVIDAATGSVAQRLDYDEFGNVILDTNPGFQPFGFAGGIYDAETGLVHFGAREYDADTSRWMTKDPIGFGGGDANVYGYVLGDPINRIDPRGLQVCFCEGPATCAMCTDEQEYENHEISGEQLRERQVARGVGALIGVALAVIPVAPEAFVVAEGGFWTAFAGLAVPTSAFLGYLTHGAVEARRDLAQHELSGLEVPELDLSSGPYEFSSCMTAHDSLPPDGSATGLGSPGVASGSGIWSPEAKGRLRLGIAERMLAGMQNPQ